MPYSLRLVILVSALSFIAGGQSSGPLMHAVPLLDCAGIPCFEMTTGSGKTLKLLLDLGSINAYLDSKAAERLGVAAQGLKSSDGGDIASVQQTSISGAQLGDLPLGDFPFMVLDTTPDTSGPGKKSLPLPADGALTFGSFKNRLIQIDLAKRVVKISEPESAVLPCPHGCGDLAVRRTGRFGPATLTATGFEVNAQPVVAQIDTLFTGTLLIYPDSVQRLGLKKVSKAKTKDDFPYVQGGLKLIRGSGATEGFRGAVLLQDGPVYFWGSKMDAPPPVTYDATVGTALLDRGVITLDFKGMHVWIDPGSQ